MTKEVDAREKELTHQVHREMLTRSLEQVKNLTPVLISGIKTFITVKDSGKSLKGHTDLDLFWYIEQKIFQIAYFKKIVECFNFFQ